VCGGKHFCNKNPCDFLPYDFEKFIGKYVELYKAGYGKYFLTHETISQINKREF
jgi:hypothetical protein